MVPSGVLDLSLDRPTTPPRDAATVVLVRDASSGIEVFCVERSKQSRFLGGAIVFPGGKLDGTDTAADWIPLVTEARAPARPTTTPFATDADHLRALAIAAARETLEEAGMLHVAGGAAGQDDLFALRARLVTDPGALRAFLGERRVRLDLQALHPFARWITPEAESRRFDARFFVAVAPPGQTGAHDEHETMASFWAGPAEVLGRWDEGKVQLAPPTHATLAALAACKDTRDVLALAADLCLDPICPRLVPQKGHGEPDTLALTLPGDPEHEVRERRFPGRSRYVLRGDRWLPEDAPR